MSNNQNVKLVRTVEHRSDASVLLRAPGNAVLIERGRPRIFLLSCPCGCGEEIPINLDPRSGPAWRLYRNTRIGISLYPSVWRKSGCKSHFIIWNGKIYLFGQYSDEWEDAEEEATATIEDLVFSKLPIRGLVYYSVIADSLGAVPWDVLHACHRLVKKKIAYEGINKQRAMFGRN